MLRNLIFCAFTILVMWICVPEKMFAQSGVTRNSYAVSVSGKPCITPKTVTYKSVIHAYGSPHGKTQEKLTMQVIDECLRTYGKHSKSISLSIVKVDHDHTEMIDFKLVRGKTTDPEQGIADVYRRFTSE